MNNLARRIVKGNIEKGFWSGDDSDLDNMILATKVALIHSEVSELLEGLRELDRYKPDKHVPHLTNLEIECADIIIRVLDFAGRLDMDITEAIEAKLSVNEQNRPNKHGKQF